MDATIERGEFTGNLTFQDIYISREGKSNSAAGNFVSCANRGFLDVTASA